MLSWGASVHKYQRISLQSAIVDIGDSTFAAGISYVALSPVKTLCGLHLIDFERNKVTCDQKAVIEYNRLRALYTPYLRQIPAVGQQRTTKRKIVQSEQTLPSSD